MKLPIEPIPLEHLVAHCTSDPDTLARLTKEWFDARNRWNEWKRIDACFAASKMPPRRPAPVDVSGAEESLDFVTRQHVAHMLDKYDTIAEAAARMGITPSTIYRMKRGGH